MISARTLEIFMVFMEKYLMFLIIGFIVTAALKMEEDPND